MKELLISTFPFLLYLLTLFLISIIINNYHTFPLTSTTKRILSSSSSSSSLNFEDILIKSGGPLCREEIRRFKCPPPICYNFEEWYQSIYNNNISNNNISNNYNINKKKRKVILSVGHNGFGNQLFQHYFSLQVAQYMNAALYFTMLDSNFSNHLPPNTLEGAHSMDLVSDPLMLWSNLPLNHPDRLTCAKNNFTYGKRPIDGRGRSEQQKEQFNTNILKFLDPNSDLDCIITIGYFQNMDICLDNIRKLWPSLVHTPNRKFIPRIKFQPNDIVIHLRCEVHHYGLPNLHFLQVVLNRTNWTNMYLLTPPVCRGIGSILSELLKYPNSSKIPSNNTITGFDDFILLSSANKMIEDVSTYSYWAGVFSSASEKHVSAQYHGIPLYNFSNKKDAKIDTDGYIFHEIHKNNYFGILQPNGKIIYKYNIPPNTQPTTTTITSSSSNNANKNQTNSNQTNINHHIHHNHQNNQNHHRVNFTKNNNHNK